MNTLSYKTVSANRKTVTKEWVIIDANAEILGRLCSTVALLLRGKRKTNFTPHVDCGDNVIIINADKIRLTGKKSTDKRYVSYTGYPGGQRFTSFKELQKRHPEDPIKKGVWGMLPKTRLGRATLTNLHIFVGANHPYKGTNPKLIKISNS